MLRGYVPQERLEFPDKRGVVEPGGSGTYRYEGNGYGGGAVEVYRANQGRDTTIYSRARQRTQSKWGI